MEDPAALAPCSPRRGTWMTPASLPSLPCPRRASGAVPPPPRASPPRARRSTLPRTNPNPPRRRLLLHWVRRYVARPPSPVCAEVERGERMRRCVSGCGGGGWGKARRNTSKPSLKKKDKRENNNRKRLATDGACAQEAVTAAALSFDGYAAVGFFFTLRAMRLLRSFARVASLFSSRARRSFTSASVMLNFAPPHSLPSHSQTNQKFGVTGSLRRSACAA